VHRRENLLSTELCPGIITPRATSRSKNNRPCMAAVNTERSIKYSRAIGTTAGTVTKSTTFTYSFYSTPTAVVTV
jgi:hypothetical protein